MPEIELENYHDLIIRFRSEDEELLKELKASHDYIYSTLEFKHYKFANSEIEYMLDDEDIKYSLLSKYEYVAFDFIFDASKLPDNVNLRIKIFGEMKPISNENKITIFHFEFDERGDKCQIYENYKMYDETTPRWMIYRAIKDKDNKFIKWLISSYPEDIKIYLCLTYAIRYDNMEAFHLFEQIAEGKFEDGKWAEDLIDEAEYYIRPEYAEYIRNHYLESDE